MLPGRLDIKYGISCNFKFNWAVNNNDCHYEKCKNSLRFAYTIYKISVRDHKGNPLYDHDWTEANITETVFTGFLNAIEIMSKEVMHVGGILDINLNEGIR